MRKDRFLLDNWYHCFNRSVEGRVAFADSQDYYRFLQLLYLANDETPVRHENTGIRTFEEVLRFPRGKRLVAIGAFSLLPDHFHLALRETAEGGITSFMRKLGTAYTLYFNPKHKRVGNLFLKPFQSRAVPDRDVPHLVSYIHASPATLIEPNWKTSPVVDPQFLGEQISSYPYSSLGVYTQIQARNRPILDPDIVSTARVIPVQKMLQEARRYSTQFDVVL